MPQVGAAIAAIAGSISTAVAAITATPLGAFLFRAVAGVALSALSQALRGKPDKPKSPGLKGEYATSGEAAPFRFPLGRTAVKGHLTAGYTHTSAGGVPNRYLTMVYELSDLPDAGLLRIIVNGDYSEIGATNLDPGNDIYGSPLLGQRVEGRDHAWVRFHDGTQTTADSLLLSVAASDPDRPWSASHVGSGIAHAVVTFYLKEELFNGFPEVTFEVEGIPLYDPRKDTTAGGSGAHRWNDPATWEVTRNAKVMSYNLLRGLPMPSGEVYGGRAEAEDLPIANWAAAMNVCDVTITGPEGARAQYEAGIEIDVTQPPYAYLRELDAACGGQTVEVGGTWLTTCGAPAAAVMAITDEDISISDPEDLDPHPGLESTFNGITATYAEPAALWEPAEIDPIYNAGWEAEDGGRRLVADLQLTAVYSKPQAAQIATADIADERRMRVHSFVLPPEFGALEPFDTIAWTSARNGYEAKLFEVKSWTLRAGDMAVLVVLRERDPDDYDWDGATEPPPPTYRVGTTPIGSQEVAGFAVAPYTVTDAGTQERQSGLRITWTPPIDPDMLGVRIHIRVLGQTEIQVYSTQDVETGVYVIAPLIKDETYEVRVRWITNRATEWSAWVQVTTPNVLIPILDIVGAAESYVMRARAGGATGEVEVVAWEDVLGGSFSNVNLRGDRVTIYGDTVVKGTLEADRLTIGSGTNVLEDPMWAAVDYSLFKGGSATTAHGQTSIALRNPGETWAGPNYPTAQVFQNGTATDGNVNVYFRRINSASAFVGYPASEGQWWEVSIQISSHRCTGQVLLQFKNSAGTFLGQASVAVPQNSSSSNNPETWPRYWVKAQAPAGTTTVQLVVQKGPTASGSDSFFFLHKPQLALTHADATGPRSWTAGQQTVVTGNQIQVGEIGSQNYIAGTQGWNIGLDGSAEFNNLVVRGWLQNEAVSDQPGYAYLPEQVLNNGAVVHELPLGPCGASELWHHTARMEYRPPQPGALNRLDLYTQLNVQLPGGAWTGYYTVDQQFVDTDAWIDFISILHFSREALNVLMRVLVVSGAGATRTNVRNVYMSGLRVVK